MWKVNESECEESYLTATMGWVLRPFVLIVEYPV